ncbi:hypothetical protein GCM10018952_44100 [Streptosporangium vulgare]
MLRDFLTRWWDWRPTWKAVLFYTAVTLAITAVSGRPAWSVGAIVIVVAAAMSAALAYVELYNSMTAPEDVDEDTEESAEAPAGGAFAVAPTPDPARHIDLRKEQP